MQLFGNGTAKKEIDETKWSGTIPKKTTTLLQKNIVLYLIITRLVA